MVILGLASLFTRESVSSRMYGWAPVINDDNISIFTLLANASSLRRRQSLRHPQRQRQPHRRHDHPITEHRRDLSQCLCVGSVL